MTDNDLLYLIYIIFIKGQYEQQTQANWFITLTLVLTGSWTAWMKKGLAAWTKCRALIWTGRGGNSSRNNPAPLFVPGSGYRWWCIIWHLSLSFHQFQDWLVGRLFPMLPGKWNVFKFQGSVWHSPGTTHGAFQMHTDQDPWNWYCGLFFDDWTSHVFENSLLCLWNHFLCLVVSRQRLYTSVGHNLALNCTFWSWSVYFCFPLEKKYIGLQRLFLFHI